MELVQNKFLKLSDAKFGDVISWSSDTYTVKTLAIFLFPKPLEIFWNLALILIFKESILLAMIWV